MDNFDNLKKDILLMISIINQKQESIDIIINKYFSNLNIFYHKFYDCNNNQDLFYNLKKINLHVFNNKLLNKKTELITFLKNELNNKYEKLLILKNKIINYINLQDTILHNFESYNEFLLKCLQKLEIYKLEIFEYQMMEYDSRYIY